MTVWYSTFLTVLALLFARNVSAADDYAAEYKKAEGSWSLASQEEDGDVVPPEFLKNYRSVMKGNTYTLYDGDKEVMTGTFKVVEVTGKILKYDFTFGSGPDKGKTLNLLLEWVDDDTYRTCKREDGKRPTDFKSGKGSGQTVTVQKRIKK